MKSLESIIPANLAETLGSTLMHALWQLAAVAVLLFLVLLLVPRRAVRSRYALGVSALFLMLALPVATFFLQYTPAAATDTATTAAALGAGEGAFGQIAFRIAGPTGQNFIEAIDAFFAQHAYLLLSIWLIGAALFTLRFLGGYWYVQRLKRRHVTDAPAHIQDLLSKLQERMGIMRQVSTRISETVKAPMVIGALKPMVLLPAGLLFSRC